MNRRGRQATLKAGGGLAKPAAPSREPTASAKPWRRARGRAAREGGARRRRRQRQRPRRAGRSGGIGVDALETLLGKQQQEALEEMEARVEETVDRFYDQGEAGKLRVRQEFRDLYG